MPCTRPLNGWVTPGGRVSFKTGVERPVESGGRQVTVSCGKCLDCRLQRSYQWALRCVHEASLHAQNSFLTLTYDDAHLPQNGSLNHAHFQLFAKRVRKWLEGRKSSEKFRYLMCGEYGEKNGRPHYHAIVFGSDWSHDRVRVQGKSDHPFWMSPTLTEQWKLGHVWIGEVTYDSAAYVARYTTKKLSEATKKKLSDGRQREYIRMSRNPGIGAGWLRKYNEEVFPDDFVISNGHKVSPPRYYVDLLSKEDPRRAEATREARARKAREEWSPDAKERRQARERITRDRQNLKREGVH